MARSTMIQRMIGAAKLDVDSDEEMEHDAHATGQAAGVVAVVAVAQAIAASGKGLMAVLVAAVIALRRALDFATGKAILTAIVGWLLLAVYQAIFSIG